MARSIRLRRPKEDKQTSLHEPSALFNFSVTCDGSCLKSPAKRLCQDAVFAAFTNSWIRQCATNRLARRKPTQPAKLHRGHWTDRASFAAKALSSGLKYLVRQRATSR